MSARRPRRRAPDLGKQPVENVLRDIGSIAPTPGAPVAESAGRTGLRVGSVSELTVIFPFAPGGAQRLRGFMMMLNGNFSGADLVGTVHNMRFVFLDDDTKLLFATAYDGEWDPHIDDFATKTPDLMDILACNCEGYPGIRSPLVKDYIASHQIQAVGLVRGEPDADGGRGPTASAPGQGLRGVPRQGRRLRMRRGTVALEIDDIQGTVLRSRPEPYYGTHVSLHIDEARGGRAFLRRLAPYIDAAADWWDADDTSTGVALTYGGLAALGVAFR
jgi:hypothetical protein